MDLVTMVFLLQMGGDGPVREVPLPVCTYFRNYHKEVEASGGNFMAYNKVTGHKDRVTEVVCVLTGRPADPPPSS